MVGARRRAGQCIAVALCAGGCVFGAVFLAGQGLVRASLWAGVLGLPVAAVGVGVAVRAMPRRRVLVAPELDAPEGSVERPEETEEVVAALLGGRGGTVGITTELHGAGGFGKTTLARMVVADRRVRQRFRGGVYMVTLGRDIRGSAIAAKANDVIKRMTGEDAQFTDPELAGMQLGALLETGPLRLLVIDDVWHPDQLAPFTSGGRRCVRLVTTRVPGLLGPRGVAVPVDQMSEAQAHQLLTSGLPPVDSAVARGLLAVTGRWPLLLSLANKIIANATSLGADPGTEARLLLDRLQASGPAVVDDLLGRDRRSLDVGQPAERAHAVRATIEASTSLLSPQDAQRFAELGVFTESRAIPLTLVALLWQETASLDHMRARQLCARLHALALVSVASGRDEPRPGVSLHDVVREFLRGELGPSRLAELNRTLVDAAAAGLPSAGARLPGQKAATAAWWGLPDEDSYLWEHLIEHLICADRLNEAGSVAGDLRWVAARVQRFGPAAAAADLSLVGTLRADQLAAELARVAHLLGPTEPAGAVIDVLHSRVADSPGWAAQVTAQRGVAARPRLANRWPLPDLPDPAFRRVLAGHDGGINALAVAPDGTWLASGGSDWTVRVWDAATGAQRTILTGHEGPVRALAVAPDGTWLASGGSDRTVRVWDAATGAQRAVLTGHEGPVRALALIPGWPWIASASGDGTVRVWDAATGEYHTGWVAHQGGAEALAVAPDGTWLASGGSDRTVRVWDAATGAQRTILTGHEGPVRALAVAPDGHWLASGGSDRTVRVWDAATGAQRTVLTGHGSPVWALAAGPDGAWLVSGGSFDPRIRIWDVATGRERAVIAGHEGGVDAVAVAPYGHWLASGSSDRTVRIWNAAKGGPRAALVGHEGGVDAVAVAPDGHWLVSGGSDRTVRVWDTAGGRQRSVLEGHDRPVHAVAVAPDGNWLASGGSDRTVRVWHRALGTELCVLAGHEGPVRAVAICPDGSWMASGSSDGTVRIWDRASRRQCAAWAGHGGGVSAVAIAPDGRWVLSGGSEGTLQIWDVTGGRRRVPMTGHSGPVQATAVAPDGAWVASGGRDGTVRVWDAATGEQRAAWSGHDGGVTAVAIAPGGRWLASAGHDRTVRIWDPRSGQAVTVMRVEGAVRACAWVGIAGLAAGGTGGLYLFDFLT
jgi:WD40 repeat protein